MISNTTFAADAAPLIVQLASGALSDADFAVAFAAVLDQWNVQISAGALAAQVLALNASVQTLLTDFTAIGFKGKVATVADLPTGAPSGAAYVVEANGHGYASITGLWIDLGSVTGPPGSTVVSLCLSYNGAPGPNAQSPKYLADTTLLFSATRSSAWCDASPTGNYTAKIMASGVQIGAVIWTPGTQVGTVSFTTSSVNLGDRVYLQFPSTVDSSFSAPVVTLSANRPSS